MSSVICSCMHEGMQVNIFINLSFIPCLTSAKDLSLIIRIEIYTN